MKIIKYLIMKALYLNWSWRYKGTVESQHCDWDRYMKYNNAWLEWNRHE